MSKKSKGGKMNWVSLVGVTIGFIGCLFVVSLDLPVLKNMVRLLPSIKKVDSAANLLHQEREPLQGVARQYLIAEEYGFSKFLNIIKKNKKNIPRSQPSAIFVLRAGGIGFADAMELDKYVFLGFQDRERVPVGHLNIFEEWVKNFKQQFFVKWGFLIITLGFAISIFSHFYKTK